jgi:FtsX-like permease family
VSAATPEQAILDELTRPAGRWEPGATSPGGIQSGIVTGGGFQADPSTIRFVKHRESARRHLYFVTFDGPIPQLGPDNRYPWSYVFPVEPDPDDGWRVHGGAGGAGGAPKRPTPWVNLGGGGWPDQFHAGGRIDNAGLDITRIELRFANGLTLDDDTDEKVALFITEQTAELPATVELLDQSGNGLESHVLGVGLVSGRFLGAVADRYPEAVLGAQAAQVLQISHVGGHVLVYVGDTWFTVVGVLKPALLDSTLDSDVFISLPVAELMFQVMPNPSEIYLRATINDVGRVDSLLAATADPQNPDGVQVNRPSNALEARAAAKGQFTTLLLGLGSVALLVGAIGIANIMVISVLERRTEIGLRRALGATRRHISVQFLTESAMLAAIGGVAGLLLGAGATEVYALTKHDPLVCLTPSPARSRTRASGGGCHARSTT